MVRPDAGAQPPTDLPTDDSAAEAGAMRAWLFNADGPDQQVDPCALRLHELTPRQLAWIDASLTDAGAIRRLLQRLDLASLPVATFAPDENPPLRPWENWFVAHAVAAVPGTDPPQGARWWLVVGPNAVLTLHHAPLPFLDELFDRNDPDSQLGVLSADSFAASLLDRMLTAYFDAIDRLEDEVDEFEVALLVPRLQGSKLPALRKLRLTVSTLRRMLASHRDLFDALSRPDFRPDLQDAASGHFVAVSARYERAVDAVENARSLLIGAFELLSARQSQQTNDSMRVLTFVTVLLGSLAVIAGVLGMNFDAALFHAGSRGLWIAIGGMALIVVSAMLWARARGWWR